MSYDLGYDSPAAAYAQPSERAAFIRRTYAHLAGAVLAFVGIEAVLLHTFTPEQVFGALSFSPYSWLIVLVAFMAASWLAQSWARSATSRPLQYLGLGLYVVVEALIFLPLLSIAANYYGPNVIPTAAILTLAAFAGLTLSVFVTQKDFSFLGPILSVGSMIALGLIVVAVFCNFDLDFGSIFSAFMVVLMFGYILYYTSNIMLHYRTDQYVAAALALFAAVATLFYYVLRIVMSMNRR